MQNFRQVCTERSFPYSANAFRCRQPSSRFGSIPTGVSRFWWFARKLSFPLPSRPAGGRSTACKSSRSSSKQSANGIRYFCATRGMKMAERQVDVEWRTPLVQLCRLNIFAQLRPDGLSLQVCEWSFISPWRNLPLAR